MKRHVPVTFVLLSSFLFFCGVLFYFLPNDYWQDEVYTLYHFVFVSPATTLTNYHSTNNHVLYSLLCNGIRVLLGFTQLSQALLHPYVLRSIPVVLSIAAVIIFYKKTATGYGKEAAIICASIWLTTFPVLCFGSQMRGYALSIFIVTLQYFSFSRIIQSGRITGLRWLSLFAFTSLSLLCLPTNIYIEASYGLLCAILFVLPSFSIFLFNVSVPKNHLLKIASAIAAGCAWTMLYYRWMLAQQPPNIFITTYHPFPLVNIQQALSVPYRFAGYRLYLPLFVMLIVILLIRQLWKKEAVYLPAALPFFLFFAPFLFFFIHGPVVVQRTFLSLVPFFALMTGLSVQHLKTMRFYAPVRNAVLIGNLLCIVITFFSFVKDSKQDNLTENHQQDLVQHYYLIKFNALQATARVIKIKEQENYPLYLDDGFGQTGIDYYLDAFHIPFTRMADSTILPEHCLILTNLKKKTADRLDGEKRHRLLYMKPDEQYNVFLCNGN